MCLDQISSVSPKPVGFFYKVFSVRKGKLYSYFRGSGPNGVPLKLGRWLKAIPVFVRVSQSHDWYNTGFHGFSTLEGAENFKKDIGGDKIVKCRYRKATVQGIEYWCGGPLVIVAREMFIPKTKIR